MKGSLRRQNEAAAMILAVSVLSLLLLSLGSILSVSLARRQRIRAEFSRDLAEVEARSLLLNLKSAMAAQIRQTGSFELTEYRTSYPDTLLSSPSGSASALFQRSFQWTGDSHIAAYPGSGENPAYLKRGFLEGLAHRPVGQFNVQYRWEAKVLPIHNKQAPPTRTISTSITVDQVPLSAFTFYSAALKTVADGEPDHLGRVYTEGDLVVSAPIDAAGPLGSGGSLSILPGAGLIIERGNPPEPRAFGSSSTPEDFQAQARGWIFERDSNPILLVRPVTTAELFSKAPLASPEKEKHRLKPLCELCVGHSVDSEGKDVITFSGLRGASVPMKMYDIIQRTGSSLELDLSKLPVESIWPSKIWIESTKSDVTTLLIKNAGKLQGDLSLATGMHIEVSGSFNTELPVRKASLMTMGRVISVP